MPPEVEDSFDADVSLELGATAADAAVPASELEVMQVPQTPESPLGMMMGIPEQHDLPGPNQSHPSVDVAIVLADGDKEPPELQEEAQKDPELEPWTRERLRPRGSAPCVARFGLGPGPKRTYQVKAEPDKKAASGARKGGKGKRRGKQSPIPMTADPTETPEEVEESTHMQGGEESEGQVPIAALKRRRVQGVQPEKDLVGVQQAMEAGGSGGVTVAAELELPGPESEPMKGPEAAVQTAPWEKGCDGPRAMEVYGLLLHALASLRVSSPETAALVRKLRFAIIGGTMSRVTTALLWDAVEGLAGVEDGKELTDAQCAQLEGYVQRLEAMGRLD